MNKIFLYIILSLSALFTQEAFCSNLPGTSNDVKSLNLVFAENTQVDGKGELAGEVLFRLQNIMDSIQKKPDAKFLLYVSNGEHPRMRVIDIDIVAKLYDEPTKEAPSKESDLEKIRALLYAQNYSVSESINLHYFITDHCLESLLNGGMQKMTSLFARELAYNTAFPGKAVDVYIYYSNQSKKFDQKDLERQFQFYNHFGFNPAINFHFIVPKK